MKVIFNDKTNYKKIVSNSINRFKKIDAVINCLYPAKIKSNHHYKDIIRHLEPYIKLTLEYGIYFQRKKIKGQIINFSSIYGNIIPRFEIYKNTKMSTPIDYVISKNLVKKVSKYYAKFFLKKNIKINSISLGGIQDNQDKKFKKEYCKFVSSSSLLNKNDINEFIFYLLSSRKMKFTGQDFCFDDGFTL